MNNLRIRVGGDFRALRSGAMTHQIFREMSHGPSIKSVICAMAQHTKLTNR